MDNKSIQNLLNQNGFPCGPADGDIGPRTQNAVRMFQAAHAFNALAIDGIPGPATQAALSKLPQLSPHFSVGEVACKHCGLAYVRRELLSALEVLRGRFGPVSIASAYRCAAHNAAVGGADGSCHQYGAAADLGTMFELGATLGLHAFSGVGNRGNKASHVDVRHVLGALNRTPAATPSNPARWAY